MSRLLRTLQIFTALNDCCDGKDLAVLLAKRERSTGRVETVSVWLELEQQSLDYETQGRTYSGSVGAL